MTASHKKNICLITFPIGNAGCIPLNNLVNILKPLSNKFYLITGEEGYELYKNKTIQTYEVNHNHYNNPILRIFTYIYTQIQITIHLIKIFQHINTVIFFIGGETLTIPMFFSKLFQKKIILVFPGSAVETLNSKKDSFYIYASFLSKINCFLSDKIILYSSSLIKTWNLEKYKKKISIAYEHSINLNKFKIRKPIDERKDLIGYVGRLSHEKGVMNFVKATIEINKYYTNANFLIIGDGNLRSEIQNYIKEKKFSEKYSILGWIPHEELVNYLNKIKILVIPSFTEGLPNIMLEAMACGTPVIANTVGSIPDVIKNGQNGYLIENNHPSSIVEAVIKAINNSEILKISLEGKKTVEENYDYEKVVEKWQKILNQL